MLQQMLLLRLMVALLLLLLLLLPLLLALLLLALLLALLQALLLLPVLYQGASLLVSVVVFVVAPLPSAPLLVLTRVCYVSSYFCAWR
jgi:hypothetical protein